MKRQNSEMPEIEFSSAKTRIKRGETTTLDWSVKGAEEATLWMSKVLPYAPEPLDWSKISRLGEKVGLSEKMELTPEETTAYYLVTNGVLGMRGSRIVIEVVYEELEPTRRPETWKPQESFLAHMEDSMHVGWLDRHAGPIPSNIAKDFEVVLRLAETWFAGPTPPGISLSASTEVMFEDETAMLTWNISNANCAEMGESMSKTGMIVSPTKTSGTQIAGGGWGAGGTPSCALSLSSSMNLTGQAPFGSSHRRFWITAHNTAGKSATSWQWVDTLSIPQFKGSSTPTRISSIRSALKTIDKLLRNGCIYNDKALDTTVAAFKNGHLKRTELWARLLAELQNIKLNTFNCNDVADNDWGAGHWADYTNEIFLEWSPSHTPYLEYVIFHELVHKCGFNGDLLKFYSKGDVENQAHVVSGACFP